MEMTERGSAIAMKTRVGEAAAPMRMIADENGGGEAVAVRYEGGSERAAAPVRTVAVKAATARPVVW